MKGLKPLAIALSVLSLLLAPHTVAAQEKAAYAIKRYKVQDHSIKDFPDDYVLEFLIPANSNWRIEASGQREKKVLSRSTVDPRNEGQYKRIVVTTGGKARYLALYYGSLDEWANAVTVYYTRIEPRGPSRPPIKPRG